MQTGQELRGHTFSIDNDPCDGAVSPVARNAQDGGQPHHQMLISPMRGDKQGMPLLVVQKDEGSTSQDDSQTSNQSSGNTAVAVDRLAMPIDITGQSAVRSPVVVWRMPELRRPVA